MTRIDFYLDFASPYAWLAFEQLPQALQGLSYDVRYHPILLGPVFKHHGHAGPAVIAGKHAWIRRHTEWLAAQAGLALQWPSVHPFNSVGLSRLAWACARQGTPNRWVCEQIFRHVWQRQGAAADDADALAALAQALGAPGDAASAEAARQQLRAATDAAIAAGVFGAPSFVAGGQLFWGLDALPMLRAQVQAVEPAQG